MSKPIKAAAFLQALSASQTPEPAPVTAHANDRTAPKARSKTRDGLKHIGGYFEDDYVEKVAILRARLKKDNSELLKLAIDDLFRKHEAKRAFGDA